MADIASLSLRIDSSQAATAADDLDKLSAAAERTATATNKATASTDPYTRQMNALYQASQSTRVAQVALNAEQEKFISSLQRQVDTAGMSKSKLLEFKAAELGVADQAKLLITQLDTATAGMGKHGAGADAAGAALQGFSLKSSTATRELIVMGRELSVGNVSRLPGSFSLFAQSSGLLALALSPVGLAAIAVSAAVGGLALAFSKGSAQSREFANSLILTNSYAGITEGGFNDLAASIAKSSGATIGSAKSITQALVSSGKFSGDALGATALATEQLATVSGKSTDSIVKGFISMADGVASWATRANDSYHFLTATQLEHIKTLEEQGDKEKAITEVMEALSKQISGASDNLGILQKAWKGVGDVASAAIDAMKGIGRVATPQDQIDTLKQRIAAARAPVTVAGGMAGAMGFGDGLQAGSDSANLASLQAQLAVQEKIVAQQQTAAKAASDAAKTQQAATAFDKIKEESLSRQEKMTKELAIANSLADKGNVSDADRQKVLADIRDRYKGPKGAKPVDTSRQDAGAQLGLDLDAIKKEQASLTDVYANAQKIIDAQHSAGLISDKTYSDDKIALIALVDKAQQDGLTKELSRLDQERDRLAANANNDKQITADRLKNAKQIADVQAQFAKLSADQATKSVIAAIQQQAALDKTAKAYADARDAAQRYLDTITQTQARELAAYGQGNKAASQAAAIAQISDKYEKQRQDLEKSKRDALAVNPQSYDPGTDALKAYQDQLALITEFQSKALASYDTYYADLQKKQGDWALGAHQALQNYYDDSQNIYKQVDTLVTDSFKGMEDALVTFVTTGKLSFKNLADTIVAEITRIVIKQQLSNAIGVAGSSGGGGGIMGLIGSVIGAVGGTGATAGVASAMGGDSLDNMMSLTGAFGTAHALGGPVSQGGIYPVNEKGPELLSMGGKQYLMMGNQPGNITPNDQIGGGSQPIIVHNNFTIQGAMDRRTQSQIAASAAQGAQRAMARNT